MGDISSTITGLDDVNRKLRELAKPARVKAIGRKATRQAMHIARDSARSSAKAIDDPLTREKIHKNIVTQQGRSRNSNEIKMRVGIKGGAAQNQYSVSTAGLSGGDTRHWRFIEFGTSYIKAFPFMRLALSRNIEAITNKFVQVFDAELTKELTLIR